MSVPSDRSITCWIADLKEGDDSEAQHALWQRYFNRLVGLARQTLGASPRGAEDEEDVALSALKSFFDGVNQGEFPDLHDRDGLWPLLAKITARKAINQRKRQLAAKRGGGRVVTASEAGGHGRDGEPRQLDFVEDDLSPASIVALNDECKRLIDLLPEPILQEIARHKLAGYTTGEIATQLGVAPRTVERKTGLIRSHWKQEAENLAGDE
ncbi:ECF sigma factor [Posidoniimonas polymericola]|uniref:ECF sigma factor n=1 Tax=Posidoniimonas polymericola TaxID=2528002 RepID=A0A5C5XW49_9BACT|nr:ECF-type sigma factor [Posidoniimonas polymericola]TWT66751.1 ECF sigma factor [Posidoniimonas polymericola]